MIRLYLAILTFVLAVTPVMAQESYTGSAQGNLTIDGKPTPLKYAYVVDVEDVEEAGLMMTRPPKYQVLFFCNRPLPVASVSNRNAPLGELRSIAQFFESTSKTAAGKVLGILLKLEPKKTAPFDTQLFYPGNDSLHMNVVGTQYPDRVTGLKREGKWLSGTALLAKPQPTGFEKGPKKYQYRITFRAPVQTEPAVTAKWEGKEALDSPPVKALREYLIAGKNGDVTALRRLTAASHLSYLKNPEVLKFLKSGDAMQLAEQVKRVVVRGNDATVTVVSEEPNLSQTTLQLVREQGIWKVYWP